MFEIFPNLVTVELNLHNQIYIFETSPQPVRPDVGIKRSPIFPTVAPRVTTAFFIQVVLQYKIAQKVTKYFGYRCMKIYIHELSKTA